MQTIQNYFEKFNVKKSVKATTVISKKKYALGMSRAYMIKMYDMGYISDPTVLNKKEIIRNILDLGIKGMSSSSGKILLSSRVIEFAIVKNKHNEEALDFLNLLLKVTEYREDCASLDSFFDLFNFLSEPKKKVSLCIYRSGAFIKSKLNVPLTRAVFSVYTGTYCEVKHISLREKVWKHALEELGIDPDIVEDGLFDKDLTHYEEIAFCDLLLDGELPITGKYASVLIGWLKEHKWSLNSRYFTQKCGLFSYIAGFKTSVALDIQNELFKEVESRVESDDSLEIVGVSPEGLFISKSLEEVEIPISQFVVISSDTDEIGDLRNSFEGITGEVYPLSYLESEGIMYTGCPFDLFVSDKEKNYFVDLEQVDLPKGNTWFSVNGLALNFRGANIEKLHFAEDSLERKLLEMYLLAEEGESIGVLPTKYSEKEVESAKNKVVKWLRSKV